MTPRQLSAGLYDSDPGTHAHVRAALEQRTVAATARALGVPARTLYHWLRRWPELRPAGWRDGRHSAKVATQ